MLICIVCACCFVGSLWKPTVRRGTLSLQSLVPNAAEVCLYCEGPAGVSACLLQVHLLCLGSASSRQLCRGESRETSRNLGGHILSERRLVGMHRVLKQQRIGWFVDSKVVRFNKAVCLQVWVIHSPPSSHFSGSRGITACTWNMLNLSTIYLVRPYLTQMFLDDGMTVPAVPLSFVRRWWMWPMAALLWSFCCDHERIQISPLNAENIGAVISRGQQGHVLGLGYKGSLGSRYKVWEASQGKTGNIFLHPLVPVSVDPFGSFAQDSRTAFELSMLLDKQLNSPYSAPAKRSIRHRDGKFKGVKIMLSIDVLDAAA